MDDKENDRDVCTSGTAENGDGMELEEAVAVLTLPYNHSSGVYSNSHHTQVRRSTDKREEDLLLESEENPRRQRYDVLASGARVQGPSAQTTENDLARQTTTSNSQDELVTSIARSLENVSLQTTTTCTPQQESCGRHDPPDGRLDNGTQLRRGGLVDVERILRK